MSLHSRLLERALQCWDRDGDGLIENSGAPDQTFDSWVMSGPSAYCGGLWLAALACMVDLAARQEDGTDWADRLERARSAFTAKLWSPSLGCYRFDSSERGGRVVMADQLAGLWYRQVRHSVCTCNIEK